MEALEDAPLLRREDEHRIDVPQQATRAELEERRAATLEEVRPAAVELQDHGAASAADGARERKVAQHAVPVVRRLDEQDVGPLRIRGAPDRRDVPCTVEQTRRERPAVAAAPRDGHDLESLSA